MNPFGVILGCFALEAFGSFIYYVHKWKQTEKVITTSEEERERLQVSNWEMKKLKNSLNASREVQIKLAAALRRLQPTPLAEMVLSAEFIKGSGLLEQFSTLATRNKN